MGEEFNPERQMRTQRMESPSRKYLKDETVACAKQMRALNGFNLLCIDTENKFISTGVAKDIADAVGGKYH